MFMVEPSNDDMSLQQQMDGTRIAGLGYDPQRSVTQNPGGGKRPGIDLRFPFCCVECCALP